MITTIDKHVAAVVLAAGTSTRMGSTNKLLADLGGKPVIRVTTEYILRSRARPVLVVTGYERESVEAALTGLDVAFAYNPDYAEGIGRSLAAGIRGLRDDTNGVVICLGDMPLIQPSTIDGLIAAFRPDARRQIIVPKAGERRGNPVLWSRHFFEDLTSIQGDTGGRHLALAHPDAIVEVSVKGNSTQLDIDTVQSLLEVREHVTR